MAILWAGTSIADLAIVGNALAVTTGGMLTPTVSEGFGPYGLPGCFCPDFAPQTELWVSGFMRVGSTSVSQLPNETITLFSPAGEALYTLNIPDHTATPPELRIKTALNTWTAVASGITYISGALNRYDIYLKIHATEGVFRLYLNGVLFAEYLGNTLAYRGNQIVRVGFGGTGSVSGNRSNYSAVMVSDTDTRPLTFYQRLPTGNGAETAWTGDYTAVDETGINDADFIKAAAVADTETFTFPALPSSADTQRLEALILSGRSRNAGGIAEIKGISRVGSTNYETPAIRDASPIFSPQQWNVGLNPATSLKWTGAEVNAAQFGVRAT